MAKSSIRPLLLLLLVMVLFHWKILLTDQFTLLAGFEGVNQGYSWYDFWTASLKQGIWPLWDPYIFAGRSFVGEMQTAAFYPLNLLLALAPFNRAGVFSPNVYNAYFVFAHFLAACFMFGLVRELGLSRFSALVAGICFSLGGFVARASWPHLLQSSIWLPVVFLFLLRALKAERLTRALLAASLSGLSLGMSILAGGLHIVFMQAIVVVTAAAYHTFHARRQPSGQPLIRAALIVGAIVAVGFAAGAVQLFPSIEYSRQAFRFLGAPMLPATQKIPYAYLNEGFAPHSFFLFFLFSAFHGNIGTGELLNPYLGAFPCLLAIIGVWKNWSNLWVRYLAGLAVAAFLYSLGSFSFLHGLLYALVPFLWMGREAARYMYLADFAMAMLVAFGAEKLLCQSAEPGSWSDVTRILKWVALACAAALGVPAVFGRPEIHPWTSYSLLLILASCGLFTYVARGHPSRPARLLAVALILFDLNGIDWLAANKTDVANKDELERLMSCRGVAAFLKSQPGLFRLHVLAEPPPNLGDVFAVQTTNGGAVTFVMDVFRFINNVPNAMDLLNVRYFLRPASAPEPGAVYQDAAWKVYGNPQAYPRAWLVHETIVEPSPDKLLKRAGGPGADPHRVALLGAPLAARLDPIPEVSQEEATFDLYQAHRLRLKVRTRGRGLLVLSEMFYPGWEATVNSRPARIYKVDGALRGIVVPAGESQVALRYTPRSILAGGVLTLLAFSGTLLTATFLIISRSRYHI